MEPKEGGQILSKARWLETQGKYDEVIKAVLASPFLRHVNFKRRFMKLLCRNYNRLGKYQFAKEYALRIMDMLKRWKAPAFKRDYTRAYFQLAIALCGLSQHSECTKTLKQALSYITEYKLGSDVMFACFYITSGKIGLFLQNYEEALSCFTRAKELLKNVDNKKHISAIAMDGVGDCLRHLKKHKEAVDAYIQTLCFNANKVSYFYANTSQKLAYVYAGTYQFELSVMCQEEACDIMTALFGREHTKTQVFLGVFNVLKKHLDSTRVMKKEDWITRRVDYLVCNSCKERFALLSDAWLCDGCSFKTTKK
jgi:tetratricopeptide (TPR) repeat protein